MRKKIAISQRIDPKFLEDMRESARMRVKNDLAQPIPKDVSVKEMTRLLTKTQGYQMSLKELRIKPKRSIV